MQETLLGALALGSAYEWGQYGVAKNEARGASLVSTRRLRAGNVRATLVLGEKYSEGKLGLAKDDAEAARLFRKAAERGDVQGLYTLSASLTGTGAGCRRTRPKPKQLFAKGDERKNTNAMVDYRQQIRERPGCHRRRGGSPEVVPQGR